MLDRGARPLNYAALGFPAHGRSRVLPATRRRPAHYATTVFERCLLIATIMILPLEQDLPAVSGFSSAYLLFALIAIYIFLYRPHALARTWLHPVFLAAYTLIALALMMEYLHPESSVVEITRVGMMIAGAVFISALLRDHAALRACMYAYIITGLAVALLYFVSGYGTLQRSTASGFGEASDLRVQTMRDNPLENSPNTMAFYSAQGAAVALALSLVAGSSLRKKIFLGLSLFCLIGAFLPMSRGGILIAVLSCGAVLLAYGLRHVRAIMACLALGIGIVALVPDAVFSRLTFTTETSAESGKMEARARIYTAVLRHLPEYAVLGVGAGNFWGPWGERSSFYDANRGSIGGAHNGPAQILIYWGLPAFLAFLALVIQSYRSLPGHRGDDYSALFACGIVVSLLLFFQLHHVLSAKPFSLGLGLVAGGSAWIWQKRRSIPIPK